MGVKAIFGPFYTFFHGQKSFFTPTFFHFFGNFQGQFFFHAHFFDFFHGLKIWFHGQNFRNFHGLDYFFHGHFFAYFLVNIGKRIGDPRNEQNPPPSKSALFLNKNSIFFDKQNRRSHPKNKKFTKKHYRNMIFTLST